VSDAGLGLRCVLPGQEYFLFGLASLCAAAGGDDWDAPDW